MFTLYAADWEQSTTLCHSVKLSDDSAVVGCMREEREEE